MLDILNTITNDYLNPLSTWIGIFSVIPIIWTWYDVVWGHQSRHKRWLNEVRCQQGTMPAMLIVDLLPGKDVRTAIEHYRAQEPDLRGIPNERIFIVSQDTWLKPDDAIVLVQKVRDAAAEILHSGADVVHYFHAGPVFAAAVVGAEFANASCRVLLYQNDQGKYINFGPLRHPGF